MIATKPRQDLESLSEDSDNGNGNGKLKDISKLYFSDMGNYPVLTRGQEIELAKTIRGGTTYRRVRYGKKKIRYKFIMLERTEEAEAAAQKLMLHNLPLVISIAKQYRDFGVPFWDLVQEGNFALLRAANGYDYRRGFKFSTYATSSITKAIYRELQKSNKANRIFSLDKALSDGSYLEHMDLIPDSKACLPEKSSELARAENTECIEHLVNQLSPNEKYVISSRFLGEEKKTLYKIGEELGMSKERVRQIQNRALRRLRAPVEAAGYG